MASYHNTIYDVQAREYHHGDTLVRLGVVDVTIVDGLAYVHGNCCGRLLRDGDWLVRERNGRVFVVNDVVFGAFYTPVAEEVSLCPTPVNITTAYRCVLCTLITILWLLSGSVKMLNLVVGMMASCAVNATTLLSNCTASIQHRTQKLKSVVSVGPRVGNVSKTTEQNAILTQKR